MSRPPIVLVTAFDAFGDNRLNSSLEALRRLPDETGQTQIVKRVLPTSFARSWEALSSILDEVTPKIVLLTGQAGGRPGISLEDQAVNIQDAVIPDNDGFRPRMVPVLPGAPQRYKTSFPLETIYAALYAQGLPAEISTDAGRFVCNTSFYRLLHHAARAAQTPSRVGFVHLPWLPEQLEAEPNAPSLDPETAAQAILIILQAVADDLRRAKRTATI